MSPSTYLVTGCSTGIGEATALHLDAAGHRVLAGVRRQADADRLAEQGSDRLRPLLLDVTNEGQIREAVTAVDDAVSGAGLDGLVNNAGIGKGGPLEFLPLDDWRTQLEVNVFGQIALTQALMALLRKARGRIVFIGSIGGRVGTPLMGPYNASKFALEGIAEALRHEVEQFGMRVAVVEPGAIKTAIWQKGREEAERLERELPAEARELYRTQIDILQGGIEDSDRRAIGPEAVAKVIERALTSPRPRHRYLVGVDAMALGTLDRALPHSAKHWTMSRLARWVGTP